MGNALKIVFVFNWSFDFSNVIDAIAIIVNSGLAIWIVKTIQNKLTNKRVLKDHFISEIKDLRYDYNEYIKSAYSGDLLPKSITRWFKIKNIKKNHLVGHLNRLYSVSASDLNTFHKELRELITNSPEYIANFRDNSPLVFTVITKIKIDKLQTKYFDVFNKIIIDINDSVK